MRIIDRELEIQREPIVVESSHASIELVKEDGKVSIYKFQASKKDGYRPTHVRWRIPAMNIKGVWSSNALMDKRIRADWELPQLISRISVDTPVISAFGHKDENVMTVTVGDPTNSISLEAAIQEEDNHIHCVVGFFGDDVVESDHYSCEIRIDYAKQSFSEALRKASIWLEKQIALDVMSVPVEAKLPVYSTWYSYHQNFTETHLIKECEIAAKLGYKVIIVDDGWQTNDGARGYDYTGDWEPERLKDVKKFVSTIQDMGIKVMFWFSVPFCGRKSKAYQRFKGKFLTEKHPWAPVFDPRFADVRSYLVGRYVQAIDKWKIDGLKLDFIDDFRVYPDTEMLHLEGRDTLSVNEGILKLIKEIKKALIAINPNVLIEFRQKYIGPALGHLGNMFRAFDCPYDSVMNRVRTTDVRLLCGNAAVHSDMLTWNMEEEVEVAALQFAAILFSVPQLSVQLEDQAEEHMNMIRFYTNYWNDNRETLLDGNFTALKPLSNYPILASSRDGKCIYGIYEEVCLDIDIAFDKVDIINGTINDRVIIEVKKEVNYSITIYSCTGNRLGSFNRSFASGISEIKVPPCGIISLFKLSN